MPFKSEKQLRTCYSQSLSAKAKGKKPSWNCDEWARKTPKCIPPIVGYPVRCRVLKAGEKIISPLYEGSRGGLYFYAIGIKVYVPADARSYAIRTYGKPRSEKAKSKTRTKAKSKR